MASWRRPAVLLCVLAAVLGATGCEEIRARQLIKDGNDFFRKGEFKQAVAKYREAQGLRPEMPQIYLHRAYAYLALFVPGDTAKENQAVAKDAIDAFNDYLKRRPEDEKTRQLMIQTLIDSGRYDDALAFFQRKLDTNAKDLEAIKALGVISSKAGRFEDGLGWYDRRAQVTPTDPEAFYAIGTLCWERLYQRSDKAGEARLAVADRGIAALKKAMDLKPKYVEAITYVNLLYRERALGHVAKEIDLTPIKKKKERLAAQKQNEEAKEKAEEARQKDLEQARHYFTMALGLRGLPVPGSQPASGPTAGAKPDTKAPPPGTKADGKAPPPAAKAPADAKAAKPDAKAPVKPAKAGR